MYPRRFEIYLIRWQLKESFDFRPCIVLDPAVADRVEIILVSSAPDLYESGSHFLIRDDDPDFPETGLKKTSYALGDKIREAPIAMLGKRLGRLEGELARDFEKWIG
jgi:mRNA-degrading endonuclease toxin of MazEF toxin-antitoxin module